MCQNIDVEIFKNKIRVEGIYHKRCAQRKSGKNPVCQ